MKQGGVFFFVSSDRRAFSYVRSRNNIIINHQQRAGNKDNKHSEST